MDQAGGNQIGEKESLFGEGDDIAVDADPPFIQESADHGIEVLQLRFVSFSQKAERQSPVDPQGEEYLLVEPLFPGEHLSKILRPGRIGKVTCQAAGVGEPRLFMAGNQEAVR